jgi:hypothetical protein
MATQVLLEDLNADGKPKKKAPANSSKSPTKWHKSWSWPDDICKAFEELRQKFMEAPVL